MEKQMIDCAYIISLSGRKKKISVRFPYIFREYRKLYSRRELRECSFFAYLGVDLKIYDVVIIGAGPGSGITHSLSHASASGVYAAREILGE